MKVQGLFIYPLKSGQGVSTRQMRFDARGPVGDRRFMIVGMDGRFRTQRDLPALTRLRPTSLDGDQLQIEAAGYPSLVVDPHVQTANAVTKVWADDVQVRDCGDVAATWLTAVLGEAVRLVWQGDDGHRAIRRVPDRQVSLADGYPLLLISAAAVTDLGARLAMDVSPRRFRANIVVEGCAAHAEDVWRRIRIGNNTFAVAKPCERCVIPSLDPDTGAATVGFNRMLASYRSFNGQIYFGQNLIHEQHATIAVGDQVEVLTAS